MAESEIVKAYLKRARDDLQASREMIVSHFHLAAISRMYYSVFYALTALLLKKGIAVHTHKQLGIEFRRRLIKTEDIPMQYSAVLEELFQARQTADYDAIPEISEDRVRELLQKADDFLKVIFEKTSYL